MAGYDDGSFLGSGFPFPLKLDRGQVRPCAGEDKIRQSIYVILMTRQGERPLRPEFGSRIWDYVFELTSETYVNLLRAEIVQAVCRWEHRVEDVTASVDTSLLAEGKIMISVDYVVRGTNHPDNLVFPFYLEEGRW